MRRARSQQKLEGASENTLHLKIFRRMANGPRKSLSQRENPVHAFDKLWLWVGSGGSTLFAIVMAVLKSSPPGDQHVFVVSTIAGAVGAIIRAVTNFFNTRTRYMAKLAKSLYLHNIVSNQSGPRRPRTRGGKRRGTGGGTAKKRRPGGPGDPPTGRATSSRKRSSLTRSCCGTAIGAWRRKVRSQRFCTSSSAWGATSTSKMARASQGPGLPIVDDAGSPSLHDSRMLVNT